jgi:hypothetical protein
MRSHAGTAPGKRGGGRKANAKGDANSGKLFHAETPSTHDQRQMNADAREADVGSQSTATIKLNFITSCCADHAGIEAGRHSWILKRKLVVSVDREPTSEIEPEFFSALLKLYPTGE